MESVSDIIQGCKNDISPYQKIKVMGEGTYGKVYYATHWETEEVSKLTVRCIRFFSLRLCLEGSHESAETI